MAKPLVKYVYSGNQKLAMVRPDKTGTERTYYFINNAQGTPVMIVDSTGTAMSRYNLDEWGNPNPVLMGDMREVNYTGKKLDPESGLYYFNQRYHDPTIGRFLTEDPAGQAYNPYLYAGNNPLMYVDPDGRFFQFLIPIIVEALKVAVVDGAKAAAINATESIKITINTMKRFKGYSKSKLITTIICLSLMACKPILGYYQYEYINGSLYYFDNGRSGDGGLGYFFAATLVSLNTPQVMGILAAIGGVGAILDSRDIVGGATMVGISGLEFYAGVQPDRTLSYILNGGLSSLPFIGMFFDGPPTYPPARIEISPQILMRSDIGLNYAEARRLYFNLMDNGYIENSPYSAKMTDKFRTEDPLEIRGSKDEFVDHCRWVLSEVRSYNEGKCARIIFGVPEERGGQAPIKLDKK